MAVASIIAERTSMAAPEITEERVRLGHGSIEMLLPDRLAELARMSL